MREPGNKMENEIVRNDNEQVCSDDSRQKFLEALCKKTGMSEEKAQEKLEAIEKANVDKDLYLKHSGWLLAESKLSFIELREKYTKQIVKAIACSDEDAMKMLAKGRKLGISGEAFIKYKAYEFTDEELKELADAIKAYGQKQKNNSKWYINVVMERTGLDEETVKRRMDFAKSKGYSYRKFITEAFYKLDENELAQIPEYKKPVRSQNVDRDAIRRANERKASYRAQIKEEMNWTDGRLDLEYLKAKTASGASFSEYFLFGLYKLTPEEGKKYMTMETHLKMQLRYIDFKGTQEVFENKTLFNTHFNEFVKRRWFNNVGLSYEEFVEKIEGLKKIIYKPVEGIEGIGIAVYEVNESEEQNKAVYEEIMNNGPANIEEFLVQNAELSEFWPNSVNTIRVMTICKDGKGHVLNAVIKFGTKANVDNYYQGGIAAGIDIETGRISTDGVNSEGILFESHPYSNKAFKGFKIPNWEKVVETCEAASCKVKDMPYVGWDIAINGKGEPEIIEGNHNQGAYLIQYSFAVSNREGRRFTIDPYLWFE